MRSLLVAGLALVPALAAAETTGATGSAAITRPVKVPGTAQYFDVVAGPADINGLQFGRQVLPPTGNGTTQAVALSKTIYLNKNGVTLTPGNNDSRTNKSTLASQTTSIPAWNVPAATWTAVVACMKDEFSRFDVTVTDVDPGAGTQHIEAVFGGSPGLLGMPNGVAGVSPFTNDCSIIEDSIVFTFTSVIPQDARLACEIMAQEVAHSYGLDHELLAADPMTYLDYTGNRSFQNMTASCGEDTARPCGINGNTCRANQNSVQMLTDRIGLKTGGGGGSDVVPPTGQITSPSANATVPPGFSVFASAADNVAVTGANLYVDGTMADMEGGAGPFTFNTSATMTEGQHKLKVEVTDGTNTIQTTEITVIVKKGATPPSGPGSTTGGDDSDEISGGCAAGGHGAGAGSLLLGLALVGLVRRRRH